MKTPSAVKTSSGMWRCKVMIDGVSHSITRSTKREAEKAAAKIKLDGKAIEKTELTLGEAITEYIELKEPVLSESTVRGYLIVRRNRFKPYMSHKINTFNAKKCQKMVSEESHMVSAKTLKNAWGLVNSVLKEQTGVSHKINLPQIIYDDKPWLNKEQIPVFCDAIKGTDIEIPALLGLESMRRSEILALTWDNIDLNNRIIHVRGAKVPNKNNQMIAKKTNKNATSRRDIPFILPQLYDALIAEKNKTGYVVTMHHDTLRKKIDKICMENGLPCVGIHGLRRSYCSLGYILGLSHRAIQIVGGWKSDDTVLKIYTKISEQDISEDMDKFEDFFLNFTSGDTENHETLTV